MSVAFGTPSAQATGTNTVTVDAPPHTAGEVILLILSTFGGTPSPSATGFVTLMTLTLSNSVQGFVLGKIATGAEPANYPVTFSGLTTSNACTGRSVSVSGGDTSSFPSSFAGTPSVATSTTTSVTVSGVSVLAGGAVLGHAVTRASGASTAVTSTTGMSALFATDVFSSSNRRCRGFYELYASAGSSGNETFSIAPDGTTTTAGIFAINPSAGGGGGTSNLLKRLQMEGLFAGRGL